MICDNEAATESRLRDWIGYRSKGLKSALFSADWVKAFDCICHRSFPNITIIYGEVDRMTDLDSRQTKPG
jgi:hypothetical protein